MAQKKDLICSSFAREYGILWAEVDVNATAVGLPEERLLQLTLESD